MESIGPNARKPWGDARSGHTLRIFLLALSIACLICRDGIANDALRSVDQFSPERDSLMSLFGNEVDDTSQVSTQYRLIFQSSLNIYPSFVGLHWLPGEQFLFFCLSPSGHQLDFDSPYLKLYNYWPDRGRIRLRAQQALYIQPSHIPMIRHVVDDSGIFSFPLRTPQQRDGLSPVYRLSQNDWFIQSMRTTFDTILHKLFFASVVKRSTGVQQPFSIIRITDGTGKLKTEACIKEELPSTVIDVGVSVTDAGVVGILGEPIASNPEAYWRFKNFWIYRFEHSSSDVNGHEPIMASVSHIPVPKSWLLNIPEDARRNVREEINFGFPASQSINLGRIVFWQHRELRDMARKEILLVRELLEWRQPHQVTRIAAVISDASEGQNSTLSYEHGKGWRPSNMHIPISNIELDLPLEPLVATDDRGERIIYTNNIELRALEALSGVQLGIQGTSEATPPI